MPGAMPSFTVGSAIHFSPAWRAGGSARRSMTFIAACADSRCDLYRRLDQQCTGMEFASEMVIKASLAARESRKCPLRFTPMAAGPTRPICAHSGMAGAICDSSCFLAPLAVLRTRCSPHVSGLIGYIIAMPRLTLGASDVRRAHAAVRQPRADLWLPVGHFRVHDQDFRDRRVGLLPEATAHRLLSSRDARTGLWSLASSRSPSAWCCCGSPINQWRMRNFGDLNYIDTMRWVIPGMTLTVLGFQSILSSFFFSILGMHRR